MYISVRYGKRLWGLVNLVFKLYISVHYEETDYKALSNIPLELYILECASCASGDHTV